MTTRPLKRKFDVADNESTVVKKFKRTKIGFVVSDASKLGDTDPFIIADFQDLQGPESLSIFSKLSSGVRWEIARLLSMGRLTDVSLDDLNQLMGSNADAAPKTVETILKEKAREISVDTAFAAERKSQCPWSELDIEEEALSVNPHSGLGNCAQREGYSGKVCFSGAVEVLNSKRVKVILERCTLGSSCRLLRLFGSSKFLRLKIPLKTLHSSDDLKVFFQRPFILWGSVFRSFYAKEGTVFLFQTNESYAQGDIQTLDVTRGLALFEFLDQFNPLELNSNQAVCKWASRFALGLSNSVPGPIIDPAHVEEINDIISSSESNMTDGCGLSNVAFNLKLRRDFNLDSTPCAVQIRYGGRKGMLLMEPDSFREDTPKLAFNKPSQIKINYDEEAKAHPANTTIDLLRLSRTKSPARISPEVIINLEHNGVPSSVFINMQNAYIAQGVDDMLFWAKDTGRDTPEFMFQLFSAVEKSESVYFARQLRQVGGEARFRGFGERYGDAQQEDDEEEPDVFDKAVHERSTAWWPDYISGCPSSLAETVMTLIDSGFTPQSLPLLRDKLKQLVRSKIKHRCTHFKYEIAQSASAFVVPDFWSVLDVDEIHFKSSRRQFLAASDGPETDTVVGDVLMTRNPCKVPTDVRKVKAVRHPKLHDLVDVIVCSTKGERRLLDFLAGGDYDGDTAIVIWDKEIVDSFVNAPERFSTEPQGVAPCFTRDETTVAKFIAENARKPPEIKAALLQQYLLGSLRDPSDVGLYSSYHDNCMVTKGYDNPRTIKLAYQFCKILDSPKTGYIIRPDTRAADKKTYWHARGPAWKCRQNQKKDKDNDDHRRVHESNIAPLQRRVDPKNPMVARRFIMDVLNDVALAQEDKWLSDAEKLFLPFETSGHILDPDLAQPWEMYKEFAERRAREKDTKPRLDLAIICAHVKAMYTRHSRDIKTPSYSKSSQSNSFTGRAIEVRQDVLRTLSRDFAANPKPDELSTIFDPALIARLRASYAYVYDNERNTSENGKGWSRFPWNVALGELCKIKSSALGSHKVVTMGFYERFRLTGDR
ncbi:RNA dependent RNA polymerase-domain-containing protein [Mycena epipterygia]|nr:RNA dependent RNA polymerase-domain-containing protein [Mycena epipterygia]